MKSLSAQKGITHIIPLFVIAVIAAAAIWFFQTNRGELEKAGTAVPIPPSQLMPLVSAQEARITICNLKKDRLFAEACQSKFDIVGKEDVEKIIELFALLDKIQNDKSIPNYERLLLSQAVFAALPTGDNPEDSESFNLKQSLFSSLKNYLTGQITAYAKEQVISEEEFKDLMKKDLQNMVDSLPKGDNAWVINVMVSRYSWKDGKPQPLYSHQYMESFDPFPNNPNVDIKNINYHVQSAVGSKASGQTVDVGSSAYKGTSEMIGYSFTIQSWKSQEYTSKDGSIEEKFLVRRRNRSDSSYQGEPYLNNLLDVVKMPSTKRPAESSDELIDQTNAGTKNISCEESIKIIGKDKCPQYIRTDDKNYTQDIEIWCFPTVGTCSDAGCSNSIEQQSRPADYKILASDWKKCNEGIE